jgi:hypothetical protein
MLSMNSAWYVGRLRQHEWEAVHEDHKFKSAAEVKSYVEYFLVVLGFANLVLGQVVTPPQDVRLLQCAATRWPPCLEAHAQDLRNRIQGDASAKASFMGGVRAALSIHLVSYVLMYCIACAFLLLTVC